MIRTNVDRVVELLQQQGKADVRHIAKQLGARQDSVDLILAYLEEDGVIEMKYGVLHTTVKLKKLKRAMQLPKAPTRVLPAGTVPSPKAPPRRVILAPSLRRTPALEPAAPRLKPVARPAPRPPVAPEPAVPPAAAPRVIKKPSIPPIVPELPEEGSKRQKLDSHITNMMIHLLSKFYASQESKQPKIAALLEELSAFADKSGFYKHRGPKNVEFMLCSLLMSVHLLLTKYKQRKDPVFAQKILATYKLLMRVSTSMASQRLSHYEKYLDEVTAHVDALPMQAPKKLVARRPAAKPKAGAQPIIPKLPEHGTKQDKMNAHIANMMFDLLTKFIRAPQERREKAAALLDDLSSFAQKSGFYKRKGSVQAEFMFCSLLVSLNLLLHQAQKRKTLALTKKIKTTRALMTRTAKKVSKQRLKYYKDLLAALPGKGGGT